MYTSFKRPVLSLAVRLECSFLKYAVLTGPSSVYGNVVPDI